MASHPGTSRRCDECRRRRKKCDLAEPECNRCISKGIKCSGPNNLRIYVHRDADNLHTQSHRGALRVAMQKRAAHHGQNAPYQTSDAVGVDSQLTANALQRLIRDTESSLMRANAPLSAKPAEFFYSTVLDAFQPRGQVGVFSGDRLPLTPADGVFSSVALSIRGLLPLAKPVERQILDIALFSLLTMYMGRLVNDSKMTDMSCSAYTSAVREFRLLIASRFSSELAASSAEYCQSFLALSTALQLFEFVNDLGNAGPGFLTHYDGMIKLLELSGPEVYQSPALLQSFSGLRGIAIFIALEGRKETFLSQDTWVHTPFLQHSKTRRERFHDIALRIPPLLAETDDRLQTFEHDTVTAPSDPGTATNADPSPLLDTAEGLIATLTKVRLDLEQWLQDFEHSYFPVPLYWETDEIMDAAYAVVDKHCIPKHEEPLYVLRFRDGQKAGALIGYWAVMLELLMGLTDIQAAVSTLYTFTPTAAIRAIILCQDMDANRTTADMTASLMFQSLPYLECCLEGVFVAQLPIRVAHRYFARGMSNSQNSLSLAGGKPCNQAEDPQSSLTRGVKQKV